MGKCLMEMVKKFLVKFPVVHLVNMSVGPVGPGGGINSIIEDVV